LEFTSWNFHKLDGQFSLGFSSRKSLWKFFAPDFEIDFFANYNSLLISRVKIWLENFMFFFFGMNFLWGNFD
jgi:hypothetical protein